MIRVVKVGGSLLDWPPLPAVVRSWLAEQPTAFNVLVPGGGAAADVVRQADRDFSLSEEVSHWLCIDALSVSARLVGALLPELRLISAYEELLATIAFGQSGSVVFDPRDFLCHHEFRLPGRVLPHDWSVTSDSIAARLAEVLLADELTLLKSCNPPADSLADLARAGYVDMHLATLGLGLLPRFVNLRQFVSAPQQRPIGHSAAITS